MKILIFTISTILLFTKGVYSYNYNEESLRLPVGVCERQQDALEKELISLLSSDDTKEIDSGLDILDGLYNTMPADTIKNIIEQVFDRRGLSLKLGSPATMPEDVDIKIIRNKDNSKMGLCSIGMFSDDKELHFHYSFMHEESMKRKRLFPLLYRWILVCPSFSKFLGWNIYVCAMYPDGAIAWLRSGLNVKIYPKWYVSDKSTIVDVKEIARDWYYTLSGKLEPRKTKDMIISEMLKKEADLLQKFEVFKSLLDEMQNMTVAPSILKLLENEVENCLILMHNRAHYFPGEPDLRNLGDSPDIYFEKSRNSAHTYSKNRIKELSMFLERECDKNGSEPFNVAELIKKIDFLSKAVSEDIIEFQKELCKHYLPKEKPENILTSL